MLSALFNTMTIKRWLVLIVFIFVVVGGGYYYLGQSNNSTLKGTFNFGGLAGGPIALPGATPPTEPAEVPAATPDAATPAAETPAPTDPAATPPPATETPAAPAPTPPAVPADLCINIDGIQETVPPGNDIDGEGNCDPIPAPPAPTPPADDATAETPTPPAVSSGVRGGVFFGGSRLLLGQRADSAESDSENVAAENPAAAPGGNVAPAAEPQEPAAGATGGVQLIGGNNLGNILEIARKTHTGSLTEAPQKPAGRDITPVGDAEATATAVYQFKITSKTAATLRGVRISLKPDVANPLPSSRIQLQLFAKDPYTPERSISELISPIRAGSESYDFAPNYPIEVRANVESVDHIFTVKAKISPDANAASGAKNFQLQLYNDSQLEFTEEGHRFVWRGEERASELMSYTDAATADVPPVNPAAADCTATQHLDAATNTCVENVVDVPPVDNLAPTDQCLNTPEIDDVVPQGFARDDATGNCALLPNLPPADLCLNIPGDQIEMPVGQIPDGATGNCADAPLGDAPPFIPSDLPVVDPFAGLPPAGDQIDCSALGMFPYTGPERPQLAAGSCIPCPTEKYILTGETCIDAPAPAPAAGDPNATLFPPANDLFGQSGAAANQSLFDASLSNASQLLDSQNVAGGALNQSGANAGQAANNTRGAAFEENLGDSYSGAAQPNLGYSQRIIRAPDRGQTGPGLLVYIIPAVLSLAAGARRYMKK